jgi:formylglycine-generating enzyme required for sulfatase activity
MPPVRLIICVLATLVALAAHAAEPRIALVIGNSEYASGPLPNPANDARMIAEALTGLGFDVVTRRNANQTTMKRAIQDFGARLDKAGAGAVGLFYYAGHGVQMNGRNYLIPTEAHIDREGDVDIEAVSADWVIEQMRYAHNRLNIVVLDACRNNPFARSMRSADRGLAVMDAPAGILIAYSTAPGSVAADGAGNNSPYTEALTRAMRDTHEPVEQVFKKVRIGVMTATSGRQIPWESSSLTGDFYFSGPPRRTDGPPASSAPAATRIAPSAPPPSSPPASESGSWFSNLFGSSNKPSAAAAPVASGTSIAGSRALSMLQSLGVQSPDIDATHSYPAATVRQLIETAPRRATLGSSPEQIRAALTMCRSYSASCQIESFSDEAVRAATLVAFELDAAPVSVGEFRQFVTATNYKTEAETQGFAYALVGGKLQSVSGGSWRNGVTKRPISDDLAVVGVSFQDAAAYCRYRGSRLPAEDEWEYAARGPERHVFPWGETADGGPSGLPSPPRANDGPAEGLGGRYRGLSGNVWQWVDTKVNGRRVLKGGSWLEPNAANRRAATRRYELAHRADEDSGFRCARTLSKWPDAEQWMSSLSK